MLQPTVTAYLPIMKVGAFTADCVSVFMYMFYHSLPQRKGICDPPSKTFYDGTLTPAASVETSSYRSFLRRVNRFHFTAFWPNPDKPIMVCNVVGSESSPNAAFSRSGGPESKQNLEEARKVVSIFPILLIALH